MQDSNLYRLVSVHQWMCVGPTYPDTVDFRKFHVVHTGNNYMPCKGHRIRPHFPKHNFPM